MSWGRSNRIGRVLDALDLYHRLAGRPTDVAVTG